MNYKVSPGNLDEAIGLHAAIPELQQPYPKAEYERRLAEVPHLVLVAYCGSLPVGFKIGYERQPDGSFYSWMGGVSAEHRRKGVAQLLADEMERWCITKGYHTLRFKTRNRFRAMLLFGIRNGFSIIGVEPHPDPAEHRIWLEKKLMVPTPEQSFLR